MPKAATHEHTLTMDDGLRCSRRTEGPFPRVVIYATGIPGMAKVKCDRMTSALVYSVINLPGKRGTASTSALFIVWMHRGGPASTVFWLGSPSVHFFLTLVGQCSHYRASHLHLLSPWLIRLLLHLLCSIAMVRIRGRPRRGAAWEAKKAQRRRKEKMERALTLANSILRKEARAKKLARLAIVAEPGVESSRGVKENVTGALQEAGFMEEFPPCIVVEEPVPEDQMFTEETRMKASRTESKPTPTLGRLHPWLYCRGDTMAW
jgi:hypothetical protein